MISKEYLEEEYIKKQKSVREIATQLGGSENKITYWLQKHFITKRTISEAIYLKSNPKGDPFQFRKPKTNEEWLLYGLGLGLFWGEGNKANTQSVRLGNVDPDLIKYFLKFLKKFYCIDSSRLRFGLQIFSDVPKDTALTYWTKQLGVSKDVFQKVVVTPTRGTGSYRNKSEFGVLTIYFSNTKLRDMIVGTIDDLRSQS